MQETAGTADRARAFYKTEMLKLLNPRMRQFIARQELVFIATADARGECDCSIRAGKPGFVHVLTPKTLLYPEYHGNGVMASLGNISENPHIGMIFVDFFESTVGLHVNGTAEILENADVAQLPGVPADVHEADGPVPERWVRVEIEEAYIHCSKHIPLLQKKTKAIHWGTDDVQAKGGDFFTGRR